MLEEELVQGLISKNINAFNEFVETYSLDILKAISYILRDSQDKDYIEECFNDVLMKVSKKCDSFKFECPFRNWVMCIAKNKALDYKRKIKRYYKEVELDETLSDSRNVEDDYLRKESANELSKIVNKLNINDKNLFIKKYILDISTTELCEYYFVSENVLYKRLSRLREKLKRLFENMDYMKEDIYE